MLQMFLYLRLSLNRGRLTALAPASPTPTPALSACPARTPSRRTRAPLASSPRSLSRPISTRTASLRFWKTAGTPCCPRCSRPWPSAGSTHSLPSRPESCCRAHPSRPGSGSAGLSPAASFSFSSSPPTSSFQVFRTGCGSGAL